MDTKAIEKVINEKIAPALKADGGGIELKPVDFLPHGCCPPSSER